MLWFLCTARQDCAEAAKRLKLSKYAEYLDELEDGGIRFKTAAFSAYGRFHPDVSNMLTLAASRAVRRHGGSATELVRGWKQDIATTMGAHGSDGQQMCQGHHDQSGSGTTRVQRPALGRAGWARGLGPQGP